MRSWGSEFHEISRFFTLFIAAVGVLQHAASSSSSRLHPTKFLDFHTCGNSQASVYTFRASHSLTCTIIYVYMHVYIHVHIYIACIYMCIYTYHIYNNHSNTHICWCNIRLWKRYVRQRNKIAGLCFPHQELTHRVELCL